MEIDDLIWKAIRREAEEEAQKEPMLASFFHVALLRHKNLEDALTHHLSSKLRTSIKEEQFMAEVMSDALAGSVQIGESARADLKAIRERDPACSGYSIAFLYFKGFHALQSYRVTHWLWEQGRKSVALYFQSRISEVFGVDIHPAARIGRGILMDHATSIVIGETAIVEDNVSMLHEVTLGGTGKERGNRHPKIRAGVLIGAGAKILGNVEVGEGAKIGAGSVVLTDVPPHCTVAGVPARRVGSATTKIPALEMDHGLSENKHRHR